MSLLTKGGITNLSELIIDANKDWQAKEIQNLKATVAGMVEGDISYRGPSVMEKLVGDYGIGYNYLHMLNTGQFKPEWLDIIDIVVYLTGAVNRMIAPPNMTIPIPDISPPVVAEDHSGGANPVVPPALAIPVPTIGDAAELSWLLMDDCEAAWDEYVQANVVSTADGVTKKIGAASAKMAVADLAAVGRLATHDIGPFDLTPYRYLRAWIYSSIALSSGDLSFLIDNHAQCISPEKDLDIGDIPATTWTQVTIDMGDTSGLGAVISIGIDMDIDKGIFDFWIDQVRATKGGA